MSQKRLNYIFLTTSIGIGGGTSTDENVQQKITLACVALLQKNTKAPQDSQEARNRIMLHGPSTKKEAIALLLSVASESDIMFESVTDALWLVFNKSKRASQTRQWVMHLLFDLMREEVSNAHDVIEVARTLYALSPQGTQEQQEAVEKLLALAARRDIPFGDTVEAAHALYMASPPGSRERQQASEMLLAQARWSDTTVAQAQEAALALCYASGYYSQERNQSIQALIVLTQRPNLSFEDVVVLDYERATQGITKALIRQQWAAKKQMWESIAQRSDLTSEQHAQALKAVADYEQWLQR